MVKQSMCCYRMANASFVKYGRESAQHHCCAVYCSTVCHKNNILKSDGLKDHYASVMYKLFVHVPFPLPVSFL
jgi:hypothetical protein